MPNMIGSVGMAAVIPTCSRKTSCIEPRLIESGVQKTTKRISLSSEKIARYTIISAMGTAARRPLCFFNINQVLIAIKIMLTT